MIVDISKAFDTLNWKFLIKVLRRFGFSDTFCTWIHIILEYALLSFAINMTLENQIVYLASIMNPSLRGLFTAFFVASTFSSDSFCSCCSSKGTSIFRAKVFHAISNLRPRISITNHANKSWFYCKHSIRTSRASSCRSTLIMMVFDGSLLM